MVEKIIIVMLLAIVFAAVYMVCRMREEVLVFTWKVDDILGEKFEEYDNEINTLKAEIKALKEREENV